MCKMLKVLLYESHHNARHCSRVSIVLPFFLPSRAKCLYWIYVSVLHAYFSVSNLACHHPRRRRPHIAPHSANNGGFQPTIYRQSFCIHNVKLSRVSHADVHSMFGCHCWYFGCCLLNPFRWMCSPLEMASGTNAIEFYGRKIRRTRGTEKKINGALDPDGISFRQWE